VLVFVTQRCRAPVDAFTVLHRQTYIHRVKNKRRTLKELQVEEKTKVEDLLGR
jgi:hypothetical protein